MRGTAVLRRALLRGMQQEVSCDVLVHMRPAGFEPRFTEGLVFNAPPTLPDGEYAAHFEGNTMLVRKENGRWLYSNKIEAPATSEPT